MKLGLALPQYGSFTDPQQAVEVAGAAEALGYDSLWAGDRILVPEHPRDRYPGGDGSIPPQFKAILDPLVVLTVAAAVTDRVRLGTNTLNALWTPPILLARSLASLDLVSQGRLDVGLGLGWSSDEYQAVDVPWAGRGARLEETLDVLETIWRMPRRCSMTVPVDHPGGNDRFQAVSAPAATRAAGRFHVGVIGADRPSGRRLAQRGHARPSPDRRLEHGGGCRRGRRPGPGPAPLGGSPQPDLQRGSRGHREGLFPRHFRSVHRLRPIGRRSRDT